MMSLFEVDLGSRRNWGRIGDFYAITKKPRSLDVSAMAEIPFSAMEAIPQGGAYDPSFTMKAPRAITSGTYFEPGDVLVAKITPSFENGKQAFARTLPAPFGYATTEVIPLHPSKSGHDPRLLFFYLLHPDVRHHLTERMEGSTGRQRVPESVLLDLPIPEIDQEEQTAIADALETIHAAAAAEMNAEQNASALKHAAMNVLFSHGRHHEVQRDSEVGPVPCGWLVDRLGSHHSVISGGTPSRSNPKFWSGGTIPWVKTGEVNYCIINETEEHITPLGIDQSAAKVLRAGTLLMAMYGQGSTRGKVAILGIDGACNQACAAITPRDDAILPRYLYHFLSWRYEEIRSLAHGGQQQNLNLEIVRELLVAYPKSSKEQEAIFTILDALDRKAYLHLSKRHVLEELFKSLLHKLMTGEIAVSDLDLSALVPASTQTGQAAA
jgi:type I restriction enzyme S subunit